MIKVKCPRCDGRGEYRIIQHYKGEKHETTTDCMFCGGTGKVPRSATYKEVRRG